MCIEVLPVLYCLFLTIKAFIFVKLYFHPFLFCLFLTGDLFTGLNFHHVQFYMSLIICQVQIIVFQVIGERGKNKSRAKKFVYSNEAMYLIKHCLYLVLWKYITK